MMTKVAMLIISMKSQKFMEWEEKHLSRGGGTASKDGGSSKNSPPGS